MKRATSDKQISSSLSSGASFSEKRFAFYLQKYFKIEENYVHPALGRRELDLFITDLNIGIEYDGRNWHDEKDDLVKNQLCKEAGIELIRIREEGMPDIEGVKNIRVTHYDSRSYNEAILELIHYLSEKQQLQICPDVDIDRDDLDIQTFYIKWQVSNSFGATHPDIAREWAYDKNKGLRPEQYAEHANYKVWWKCELGHYWMAKIAQRVNFGTGCPYCSGKKVLKGFNDLATKCPESLTYWDYENNSKTPQDYTENSEKRVHWRCPKGHRWEWQIGGFSRRAHLTKFICPDCPRPLIKETSKSLVEVNPDFLKEWAHDLNDYIKPEDVPYGSGVMVWWRCSHGHTWKSTVSNRTSGQGCPVCSNNQLLSGYNDLETRFPEIASEWDTVKNGIPPSKVFPGTVKKYWWICKKGHSYQASPNKRTSDNDGCPYCSNHQHMVGFNDLATTNPELLSEWDYTKNKDTNPEVLSKGSSKKVWWICSKGHSYEASPSNRVIGRGCPYCSNKKVLKGYNDLETVCPDVARQWHPEKNGTLKPSDVVFGSTKEIWWICDKGHEWETKVFNRTTGKKTGCPVCSYKSRAEARQHKRD